MRIKEREEDFIVEEEAFLPLAADGKCVICRVRKKGISTLEVQERLSSILGIPQSRISFPALKDKDAVAIQHASIEGEVPQKLRGRGFEVEALGRARRHLKPGDLRRNKFRITLRDLSHEEAERIKQRLEEVRNYGFPNYFDAQRFGSFVPEKGFLGRYLLLGDMEGALRLFLASPMLGDPPAMRRFKERAGELWGRWEELMKIAPRSPQRSVLVYLKDHPLDFRGAVRRINPRLLSVFLSAYQSFLWNKAASLFLERRTSSQGVEIFRLEIAGADLVFYSSLPRKLLEELEDKEIPLPRRGLKIEDSEIEEVLGRVMEEEGLNPENLKVRFTEKVFLSGGSRRVLAFPQNLSLEEGEDELFCGRRKLVLSFSLPPGSYATMLLRSLRGA